MLRQILFSVRAGNLNLGKNKPGKKLLTNWQKIINFWELYRPPDVKNEDVLELQLIEAGSVGAGPLKRLLPSSKVFKKTTERTIRTIAYYFEKPWPLSPLPLPPPQKKKSFPSRCLARLIEDLFVCSVFDNISPKS